MDVDKEGTQNNRIRYEIIRGNYDKKFRKPTPPHHGAVCVQLVRKYTSLNSIEILLFFYVFLSEVYNHRLNIELDLQSLFGLP